MNINPEAGRRALVAGGCGGIGRAVVDALLTLGLKVAVLDHSRALDGHPPPSTTLVVPADAADPDDVAKAFAGVDRAWGGLDILIYLAGIPIFPPRPSTAITAAQWDEVMAVNLRGAWACANAALPLMDKAGGGAIVTVSSSLAFNPNRGSSAYVASKGGLVALTKALAVENAPKVRANVVAPSAVGTEFLAGGTGRDQEGDDWFRSGVSGYVAGIPLGRVAEPEDVVGPILFLAGEGARYITGQVLHVNGGRITP
jgi:NAD(P)-dependent dehydrogenase (short-subunit alcohol dehydrogenase family)